MNITATPLAVTVWRDQNASAEEKEQKAVALRLSIAERCALVTRQKERYAAALELLADVPLPYDCRLPQLQDECLEIERRAWRSFVGDLHLREVLSVKAREKLDRQLSESHRGYGPEEPLPPFTEPNAWGFFEQVCARLGDMLREAVVEVFKWLTPGRRWSGLKTNSDFRIGPKVICCGAASPGYRRGMQANVRRRAEIDALGNVLSMLDGKGVAKHPDNLSNLWTCAWEEGRTFESGYMTAKAFANGNVHITFKRPDLVEKMNQAGNEAALPGADREESRGFSH